MPVDSQNFLAMLLTTPTGVQVLAICFLAVLVFPRWWMGVVAGAFVSAVVLFYARSDMAPRLNIPDPGAVEFAFDFVRAYVVAGVFALLKWFVLGLRRS